MMLKKSSSPSVSNMEETVCLAMVSLRPFMLPLTSTKITTSLGDVAAWMYLKYGVQLHILIPWVLQKNNETIIFVFKNNMMQQQEQYILSGL